jgi:uncharacterized protein YkwD
MNRRLFVPVFMMCAIIALTPLAVNAKVPTAEAYRLAINHARQQAGLPSLQASVTLDRVAQRRVNDMARRHYFAHRSPTGSTYLTVLATVPQRYSPSGEILGRDFLSASAATRAWLASASHATQIHSKKYQQLGVAVGTVTMSRRASPIVVVIFGRRR